MIRIDWGAASVIIASLALLFTFITWRQKQQKDEITSSVNNLRDVLLEKLETKDNVNQLKIEIAKISTDLSSIKDRLTDLNKP